MGVEPALALALALATVEGGTGHMKGAQNTQDPPSTWVLVEGEASALWDVPLVAVDGGKGAILGAGAKTIILA
jgi:hypothetical protein